MNKITIDPAGPKVEVEIKFSPLRAQYEIYLYDQNGENPEKIKEGLNFDQIPDICTIDRPPDTLKGRVLYWQARMTGETKLYTVQLEVRQSGNACPDSPFTKQGPIDVAKHEWDMAQFTF